ncbi:MAG: Uma2 family endonuclease [Tolypothrix brevis GSE-NOS-MK-07-07A]|jgi:Uma2 family endonuclease|nr:Uma2 family endonuclease [Tolypothrix brevis GSE-NOS-MK-07-07A]
MSIPLIEQPTQEKLVTLPDVSWEQFKGIEAQLKDNHNVRLSYFSGILEIMSPIGDKHEKVKSTLGLLVEAYMRVKGIRFYKRGGFTLEEPGYASGTPDESYCIGTDKETPDIVIEIIVTSGTINRKELYKPKKVPEVWFWKKNEIKIFRLTEQGEYEEVNRSGFFPDLDPNLLLQYIAMPDQYDAVQEFERVIRRIN